MAEKHEAKQEHKLDVAKADVQKAEVRLSGTSDWELVTQAALGDELYRFAIPGGYLYRLTVKPDNTGPMTLAMCFVPSA